MNYKNIVDTQIFIIYQPGSKQRYSQSINYWFTNHLTSPRPPLISILLSLNHKYFITFCQDFLCWQFQGPNQSEAHLTGPALWWKTNWPDSSCHCGPPGRTCEHWYACLQPLSSDHWWRNISTNTKKKNVTIIRYS